MGKWTWVSCAVWWAFACNTPDAPPVLSGRIAGQIAFLELGAGVPVSLHQSTVDGALLGAIAEASTDSAGSFQFEGLREPGHYAIRVNLEGRQWSGGRLGPDDRLLANVGELRPFSPDDDERHIYVSVSAWSTLLVAVAEARREAGETRPLAETREAFRSWFGFDVLATAFEPPPASLSPPVQHVLLTDAFEALADQIAGDLGVQAGTVLSPADLLRALREDAAGSPPGVFDGQGPNGEIALRGVSEYALSAHTLQTDLLRALDGLIEDPASRWGELTLADVRPLRARLACAAVSLFPECAPVVLDQSPPVFSSIEPVPDDVDALSGVVDVYVHFADPEGQVVEVVLERTRGARGAALERYVGDAGGFVVDTTSVIGNGTLYLAAQAKNDSGLWSEAVHFEYPVRNVGDGVLGGSVFKGIASGVTVTAYGGRDGVQAQLAQTVTGPDGGFGLRLTEFQGTVRVVASAGPEGAYYDEARGMHVRWPQNGTLSALVPGYDPRAGMQSVTISPFSDLALALAETWTRRGDGPLDAQYQLALDRVARHLGIQSTETLIDGHPAPLRAAQGFEDPERFLLGLACLAEQARGLASVTFPEAPSLFTALDLQALYRVDATDGALDGLNEGSAVEVEIDGRTVQLPIDAFRHPLATACARWLRGADNPTGLDGTIAAHQLDQMAMRRDPNLFDGRVDPRPFDTEGPALTLTVTAANDGHIAGPPWVAAGPIDFVLDVHDEAGIETVSMTLLDQLEDLLDVQAAVEGEVTPTRKLSALLDTDALPARFDDVPIRLRIIATDLLGNTRERVESIIVDRTLPEVILSPPESVGVWDGEWHTNEQVTPLEASVEGRDARPVTVTVELAGEPAFGGGGEPTAFELHVNALAEGRYPLIACATDILERQTCVERTVVVDITGPTARQRPTRYQDERDAVTEVEDGVPSLDLSDASWVEWAPGVTPLPLHKTQLSLGEDAENLPELRWSVSDDQSPPATMRLLSGRTALPAPEPDERTLSLSSATLDVDPAAPPNAGTTWSAVLQLQDLAGNRTAIQTPTIALYITAPPPLIEELETSQDAVHASELTLGGEAMERALDDAFVEFGRFRISNPWPVEIYVRASQSAVRFAANTTDGPTALADFIPETGNLYDRLDVEPCLFRQDPLRGRVPDESRALQASQRRDRRVLYLEAAPGAECVEKVVVARVEAEVVEPVNAAEEWRTPSAEADTLRFAVRAPAARPYDPALLGSLLRLSFQDTAHSAALELPFLQFHEPRFACLAAADPWGCLRGWWITARVRRIDSVALDQPEWRLDWAPGEDSRCEDCATAGRVLTPATLWQVIRE